MNEFIRARANLRHVRLGLFALAAASTTGCKGKMITFDTDTPAVSVVVFPYMDMDAGVSGQLQERMSTAFASAVWQYGFFDAHPDEQNPDASALVALAPEHVLVQVYDSPEQGSADAPTWDFSELDSIVQPLLQLGQDPALQIVSSPTTPAWLDPSDQPDAFAEYCANIVRYYDSDGGVMLPDGGVLRSAAGKRINWWAILSDPNTADSRLSYSTGVGYASVYSNAVTRMSSVDPAIQFMAPEFNDCYDDGANLRSAPCIPSMFIPDFLGAVADAGPPIDALSLHMFPATYAFPGDAERNLAVDDNDALHTILPDFAADVAYVRQQLNDNGYPRTPIWITENQINSDSPLPSGASVNYHYHIAAPSDAPVAGDVPFEADSRGTDIFFAAWRPALFSQLGKVGVSALFQWQYTAGHCPSADAGCSTLASSDTDRQNAEVDYNSGAKYLSYWVDWELSHKFSMEQDASTGADGSVEQDILSTQVQTLPSSNANIEVLATHKTQNGAEDFTIMVVNTTVSATGPAVDGPGEPETVIVDVSALVDDAAWSASILRIDATAMDASATDLSAAPPEVPVPPSSTRIPISFAGYGVAFLTLTLAN